jgi:Helix-turn-helix domain
MELDKTEGLWNSVYVARILGISPTTLPIWRCNTPEKLPFIKVGRAVRYRPEDVRAFIEKNRKGGETPEKRKKGGE